MVRPSASLKDLLAFTSALASESLQAQSARRGAVATPGRPRPSDSCGPGVTDDTVTVTGTPSLPGRPSSSHGILSPSHQSSWHDRSRSDWHSRLGDTVAVTVTVTVTVTVPGTDSVSLTVTLSL